MRRHFWLHALAGLVILAAAACWNNFPHLAPGAFNWAEPGNIAAALVQGRGFSDPFDGGTGATAWMPPAYPLVVAAMFSVAGVKTAASAAVLMALAVLALASAHALLIAAIPAEVRWLRVGASVAFLFLVGVMPGGFFDVQSEAWLAVLCSTLLLWGASAYRRAPVLAVTAALATGAAVGALTHAGLLLGAGAVLLALGCLDLRAHRIPRAPVIAAAVLIAACGAWTLRNHAALGRWVPIKSNLWFELYLTSVVSPDGLLRARDTFPRHPFFSPAEFARYAALGELAYVDSFRAPAIAAIRVLPGEFARRVATRAVSAFGAIAADESMSLTRHAFSSSDRARLGAAGLLLLLPPQVGSLWLALDDDPQAMLGRMNSLQLDTPGDCYRDWLEHRRDAAERRAGWPSRWSRLLLSGLPMLALGGAALLGHGRLAPVVAWAALLHFTTLAPYVLVNHGARQQYPQTALHALFLAALPAALVARRRTPQP